ncbi:MAG: phage tail tape measure protein [Methylophilaceae bacterium]
MAVNVGVDLNPNTKKVEAALARIQAQAKGIDFGGGARSIEKLSRPLGKITGQATEFQKSLEASNARVLAFGASVAVINKLSQAFGALVANTIKVEATFAKINTILGGTQKQLEQFGNGIFKVAQNTATSFDQVAEGALELARQGLSVEESLSRVETALKLVRVAGIDSKTAVEGLTAAVKGFEGAGLSVANIADKLAQVDTKFAVSTEDLINGLERASASARVAGVSFDELLAVVTTVQERTQRGGAVIGNAFKTIFARLGRTDTLEALEGLGISTLDASGNVRSAIPLFQELAVELDKLGLKSIEAGEIIQKVAGVRQRDILISLVEDLTSGQSQFANALNVSAGAAGALDSKNKQLNDTLEALINNLTIGAQKLSSVLGDLGFADSAKDILKFFSSVVNGITDLLQGDSIGSKFAQGLVKGIGSILTGPGLALIGAIFVKLFVDLAKFGASSLKSLLGINKAAEAQKALQQSVLQTLLQNETIQREILALEGNKVAQEQLLLKIYNQQAAALARVQKAAATVTPGLFGAGFRGGERGVVPTGRASGGYVAAEARDVSRGVGGASANSKVVSIPNFAFGGGKRGTMVANTSEYIVPNFAGGGDAIFNRDMVRSMGLPAGARKINAAGGYIPNFANRDIGNYGFLIPEMGANRPIKPLDVSIGGKKTTLTGAKARGIIPGQAKTVSDPIENRIRKSVIDSSAKYANELQPLGRTVSQLDIEKGFGTIAGAKGALQAAIGSAFEVGITTALDYKAAIREKGGDFDIRGGASLPRIRKLFGMPASMSIADLKVSDSVGNVESYYSKVMKEIGAGSFTEREKKSNARILAQQQLRNKYPQFYTTKGDLRMRDISPSDKRRMQILEEKTTAKILKSRFGNAAGGYIPNFAGGALDEAIAREQAAGLPINQIRINQSGKLRNSENPMGLAVTNTRDEPTGAIPNFAKIGPRMADGSFTTGGGSDSGSGGGLFALFALQGAVSGLTNTFDETNETAQNFGSGLNSLINTLLILNATGLGPKGLGGFVKLGKIGGTLQKGFFGLTRFLGPVGLGLGGLDAVLKAGGAGGIVETFKTLKGAATGDIFREAKGSAQERALKSLEQGKFIGTENEGVMLAQTQVRLAELNVADERERAGKTRQGRQKVTKDLAQQEKFLERARAQLTKATERLQEKEAKRAAFASGAQLTAEAASGRVGEFFAQRGANIEVAAGEANLKNQLALIKQISLTEKNLIEDQIQSNDLEKEILLSRNDSLEALAKELVESKKIEGVESEKLESILTSIDYKENESELVRKIATQLGIEQGVAKKIVTEAKAKNKILDIEGEKKRKLLQQTQALADLEAEIAESRRLANRLTTSNRFETARSDIVREAAGRGADIELASGPLSPERKRAIEFLKQESRLQTELASIQLAAKNSNIEADLLQQQVRKGNLDQQDEAVVKANLQAEADQKRLEAIEPLIKAEIELARVRSGQGGLDRGMEALDQDILNFRDTLGEQIPSLFSNNLSQAMKDAISETKSLEDALLGAAASFTQSLANAFIDQAARQATSAILNLGGGEGKGILGGLFSGGAVKPDGSSQQKALYVKDVAGGAAGDTKSIAEELKGEGDKEGGIFGKLGEKFKNIFGELKNTFSDLFGGLKDSLGNIFNGLKDNIGSIFKNIGGMFNGGGGGGIGGFFTGLFSRFFNQGGPVGRGTDTVPAMLTPGEFIVRKDAVDKYGTSFLSALNNGALPMKAFQNGGTVTPVTSEVGSGALSSSVTNNSQFSFNIENGSVSQEGNGGQDQNQRQFAQRIKQAVTTVIQEESRLGGTLSYLKP